MDKDGNGKVSSKEWGSKVVKNKEILSKFFGGTTPAEIGQAFKRIDANGDGSLSWDEFVGAAELKRKSIDATMMNTATVMQTEDGMVALKELFDSMDKNSDGAVDSKEWGRKVGSNKEVLAKFFGGATPAEIGQAFKRIDTNKDGVLSWEEFVAAADAQAKKPAEAKPPEEPKPA